VNLGNNWKFIAILVVVFVLFGINTIISEQQFKKIETLQSQLNKTNSILSGIVQWSYQANNVLNSAIGNANNIK
jgi:hypothetical protein